MPNHRMLAVAALIVLSVPALGAAAPYLPVVVSNPTGEQLVEGHTVFTVIEVNRTTETNGTTRFAAAVAVLVREYVAENRAVRFPGVLWFNDQYLVNPQSQNRADAEYRYPCGGAVMAVNQGDPDPRVLLANAHVDTPVQDFQSPSQNYTVVNASVNANGVPYANLSGDTAFFHGTNAGPFSTSYQETYVITDPNDHTWTIDLYKGYYRTSLDTTGAFNAGYRVYEFPIWVVNILGGQTFLPDDGETSCEPFYDALDRVFDSVPPQTGPANGPLYNDNACAGSDWPYRNGGTYVDTDYPTVEDKPCAGYEQPSRNGYCYGGQDATTAGACGSATKPLRTYNALLYFRLEHLRVPGAENRTHNTSSTDTNGCHAGTEWTCPGGVDDAEGNSHPFHPAPHSPDHAVQGHREPCVATGGGYQPNPNPTNHGGSTQATYTGSGDDWTPAPCDYTHATREIDIYFSPQGRPLRPLQSTLYPGAADTQGSDAPFHDYNSAYGTTEP